MRKQIYRVRRGVSGGYGGGVEARKLIMRDGTSIMSDATVRNPMFLSSCRLEKATHDTPFLLLRGVLGGRLTGVGETFREAIGRRFKRQIVRARKDNLGGVLSGS